MTITPELLAAYADGELDYEDRHRVEAAMVTDPALVDEVRAHRALRAQLEAHYGPIFLEPLPERLLPAELPTAAIVDFAAAKEVRHRRRAMFSRSAWPVGGAIAAMLVLGVMFSDTFRTNANGLPESTVLALDSQSSGEVGETRVLLSFVDKNGSYCRVYTERSSSGIACRSGDDWLLRWRGRGDAPLEGEMRQASSADAFTEAQRMSASDALDAAQEAQAIADSWVR
jgi:hypothetical protein